MPRRYADWRSWFKQPVAVPEQLDREATLDPQEARVISAWGLTPSAWNSLTDIERAVLRFDYLKAPRFVA